MSAIEIIPADHQLITVQACAGLPVVITSVQTEKIQIKGVAGIPGPKGEDGDTLDPNFIIDGGNF